MTARRLSHFRILDTLGEGGMGLVYKAEDERLHRTVALKVLRPAFVSDPERRRRFVQEARTAAAISHPAVASVYEAGEADGEVFIAMEYVEGPTLRAVLDQGRPPVPEAVRVAAEIARGLAKAHASGVVHRDLKPENVILGPEGRVKILDFGLAKLREEQGAVAASNLSLADTLPRPDATREGTILGTVAYMSPEQARGLPVGARSDLFSLGVLLHEALTGGNPFRGPTPADSLTAVLKESPPPASERNPEVPASLDRLLARLLAKDPADRPASAAEVAEELESLARAPAPSAERCARSIAVLPFADMSPEKDQDYLCQGIAEELTNSLGQVEGLRVAARTSASQFRGRADDVRRIGRELGVDCVLEGSVRKAGTRLRVTAQLVGAADGYQLWSQRYDRELADVFALQDEIAVTIAETLRLRLRLAGAPARGRHATGNVDAYRLYLQGRHWWDKRHEGGLRKAADFFEQAISKDPAYALAHAGLADAYSVIGFYAFAPPKDAFARAKRAAEAALALDDGLPEAHVSMALVRFWFDWDFAGAERSFRRSLASNPSHVTARIFLGQLLAATGRAGEAEPEWASALDLDPLSSLTHGIVGSGLYFARRYEESLARCRRALEIDPDHIQSLFAFASTAVELGRHAEAIAAAERAVALSGRAAFYLGVLGFVRARAGHGDEARRILAELERRAAYEYLAPFLKARIRVCLGERASALGLLEQAHAERNSLMFAVAAFREFDVLRDEPGFQALLERLFGLRGATAS